LLFERDLLDKLTAAAPKIRLARLEANLSCALGRDDMTAELLSLWHQCGNANEAAKVLATRKFHPWEGGEGKVTGQFILNHLLRGWELIERQQPEQAAEVLNDALHYPENLSEGRLSGQTDNDIWFWLGVCARQSGQQAEADRYLRKAAQGDRSINVHRYYNDQPVEYLFWQGMALRLLGQKTAADELFGSMRKWAENMKYAEVGADFFAVSQPDLLALYGDLQRQQSEKCLLVEALAAAGMGDVAGYRTASEALEKLNPVWPGAPLIQKTFSFLQHLVH
jgi:tetratricopeptide (TPR) repeat protein